MMVAIFLRTAYNYDMFLASDESAIDFTGQVSKTQQSFAEEVDINTIVRRFGLTGEMPDDLRPPQYGDFTGISDYREACQAVRAAEESFMSMPADVRARFGNDPQRLLEFLADGDNRAEAVKLGLVLKPPEVTRDAVKAIDELAAKLVVPKPAA